MRYFLLCGAVFAMTALLCSCAPTGLRCDSVSVDLYDSPTGGTAVVLACSLTCRKWSAEYDQKSRTVTCYCDGKTIASGQVSDVGP